METEETTKGDIEEGEDRKRGGDRKKGDRITTTAANKYTEGDRQPNKRRQK